MAVDRPAAPARRGAWGLVAGWAGLIAWAAWQTAQAWRHFPSLLQDQGWYLLVSLRVSQGDILYRDVAWEYGPLPVQLLAALWRRFGPDAALASLLNGLLLLAGIWLSYLLARALLAPATALLLTAIMAVVGVYVGGDLARLHLYIYTPAIAWGSVLSLASLAAMLAWQRDQRRRWPALAGLLTGLAVLSKIEFGVMAAGACAAALFLHRPRSGQAAALFLGSSLLTAGGGLAWQAASAGWWPIWRGYALYDELVSRQVWGIQPGMLVSLRWLLGLGSFWFGLAVLAVTRTRPTWRRAGLGLALLAGLVTLGLMLPDLAVGGGSAALAHLRRGEWQQIQLAPAQALTWLAALPWGALFFVLLAAGWQARRRSVPVAWWPLWALAVLANLRYVMIGAANGFVAVPSAALLWWLWVEPGPAADAGGQPALGRRAPGKRAIEIAPDGRVAGRPPAWTRDGSAQADLSAERPFGPNSFGGRRRSLVLWGAAVVGVLNLGGQALLPDLYFTQPRGWVMTAVGPVALAQEVVEQVRPLQAAVQAAVATSEPIFVTGFAPGWYLLAGRPNPTPFDIVHAGLGTTVSDAALVQRRLAARPPQAIIMPAWQWRPGDGPPRRDALAVQQGLAAWWGTLSREYTEAPVTGVSRWVLLVRR